MGQEVTPITNQKDAADMRAAHEKDAKKIVPSEHQVGAREFIQAGGNRGGNMAGFPPADCVFANSLGIGATAERTPAVMNAVDEASAEANKLFPKPADTITSKSSESDMINQFTSDFTSTNSAAYRYIMNAEGLDDYSALHSADVQKLNAANPKVIPILDAFVAHQKSQGLVPQDIPKECSK